MKYSGVQEFRFTIAEILTLYRMIEHIHTARSPEFNRSIIDGLYSKLGHRVIDAVTEQTIRRNQKASLGDSDDDADGDGPCYQDCGTDIVPTRDYDELATGID